MSYAISSQREKSIHYKHSVLSSLIFELCAQIALFSSARCHIEESTKLEDNFFEGYCNILQIDLQKIFLSLYFHPNIDKPILIITILTPLG